MRSEVMRVLSFYERNERQKGSFKVIKKREMA